MKYRLEQIIEADSIDELAIALRSVALEISLDHAEQFEGGWNGMKEGMGYRWRARIKKNVEKPETLRRVVS